MGSLSNAEAKALLKSYGIPLPEEGVAKSREEAAGIAEKLGYPVVLKVLSPDIPHKTEAGGVLLGLEDEAAVKQGYAEIMRRARAYKADARIEGVLVQKQVSRGREVIIGALRDRQFDGVVMFGLGGVFVEVLRDVSFRIAPIDEKEALGMIQEIRGYPLLEGFRGSPPVDTEAIARVIAAASRMIHEHPELLEMDINPLIAYPRGALAVDVRIIREE